VISSRKNWNLDILVEEIVRTTLQFGLFFFFKKKKKNSGMLLILCACTQSEEEKNQI
jgi:hypothetical protein